MSKKGEPKNEQPPPLESPNWVLYEDALEHIDQCLGDAELAVREIHERAWQKLIERVEPPFVSRTTPPAQCVVTRRVLPPGTVEPIIQTRTVAARKRLVDGWRNRLMFALDNEVRWGRLFVWRPNLKIFYPDVDAPASNVDSKAETPVVAMGTFKAEWVWLVVEILRLHRKDSRLKPFPIYKALVDRIEDFEKKPPSQSKMLELINLTLNYADSPQPPPLKKGTSG